MMELMQTVDNYQYFSNTSSNFDTLIHEYPQGSIDSVVLSLRLSSIPSPNWLASIAIPQLATDFLSSQRSILGT